MNRKCSILITSCYAYRDVLKIFEVLFKKYWKDCPFEIILSIDRKIETDFPYDRVVISKKNGNLERMRQVDIKTPYVIMLQDDHFLFDYVDNEKIFHYIELAEKYNTGNLRLFQDPKTNTVFNKKEKLMFYKQGTAYRISARGGLWNTLYFEKFVNTYKDLWDMERNGQQMADNMKQLVLATKFRILPIIDAVSKGKYLPFVEYLLEANEIEIERPIKTDIDCLKDDIKTFIFNLNPNMIARIQAMFNIGYKPKYKK